MCNYIMHDRAMAVEVKTDVMPDGKNVQVLLN